MGKDVVLYVQKDKSINKQGELVTGSVNLKSLYPLYVSKIELRVYKRFLVEDGVQSSASFGREQSGDIEKEVAYDRVFLLYKNPLGFNEFSSGHHAFPFQVQLKKSDGGSVNAQLSFDSGRYAIENRYFLEASLYKQDSDEAQKTSNTAEIHVQILDDRKKSIRVDFSYCFCFFNSSCFLEAALDKKMYFSGDTARIRVSANEGSGSKIKSVIVELFQCLDVVLGDRQVAAQRLISKTKGCYESDTNAFFADMRIPFTTPSNSKERHLKLKNVLCIHVSFDRSLPIKVKKSINIV